MRARLFRRRDVVDERRGKARVQRQARRAAVAAAAVRAALIADFLEIGIHDATEMGGVHAWETAFRVPNEN
jgi:hypothetical protein